MSLGAIQDNMAKTSLVQHTQAKGDDIQRGQQIGHVASQKEHDRQYDEVVLHLQQKEEAGIRRDEERNKEGKKRRQDEGDEGQEPQEKDAGSDGEEAEEKGGTRARMRTINIII